MPLRRWAHTGFLEAETQGRGAHTTNIEQTAKLTQRNRKISSAMPPGNTERVITQTPKAGGTSTPTAKRIFTKAGRGTTQPKRCIRRRLICLHKTQTESMTFAEQHGNTLALRQTMRIRSSRDDPSETGAIMERGPPVRRSRGWTGGGDRRCERSRPFSGVRLHGGKRRSSQRPEDATDEGLLQSDRVGGSTLVTRPTASALRSTAFPSGAAPTKRRKSA
jgi:hypothetical protein